MQSERYSFSGRWKNSCYIKMGIHFSNVLFFKKINKVIIHCHCCRKSYWFSLLCTLTHFLVLLWSSRTKWQIQANGLWMKVTSATSRRTYKRAELALPLSFPSHSDKGDHGLNFWSQNIKEIWIAEPPH